MDTNKETTIENSEFENISLEVLTVGTTTSATQQALDSFNGAMLALGAVFIVMLGFSIVTVLRAKAAKKMYGNEDLKTQEVIEIEE